jgi:RNA polymerase sigma factor (sigma-70 family)
MRCLERSWTKTQRATDTPVEGEAELVVRHEGLAIRIARQYRGSGVDHEDLVAAGRVGLLKAARRFDPARQVSFGTYAAFWVRREIRNEVLALGHPVRIPRESYAEASRYIGIELETVEESHSSIDEPRGEPCDAWASALTGETERLDVLHAALADLDERIRMILMDYYGLGGRRREPVSSIALRFGITEEWVRRLRHRGLSRLRTHAALKELHESKAA